jgi:PAS domain S-box-containing protein
MIDHTQMKASLRVSEKSHRNGRTITQLKRVEEELRASEVKYRQLVENIDALIYAGQFGAKNLLSPFTFVSDKVERILGYRVEEFLDDPSIWFRNLHPDDVITMQAATQMVIEGKSVVRVYRMRKRDSEEYCWLEDRVVPQLDSTGRVTGFFGMARDITEHKKAEEALRLSESKYRTLVENANDFIFLIGKKDEIMSINPAATRILGKTVEQVLGKSLFDVYPKDIATMFSENVRAVLQTGKNKTIDEKIVFAGNELWLNTRLEPLLDDKGRAYAVTGVARDITERKSMEERLRESEEKFRTIFQSSADGVIMADVETMRFTYANPAICSLLGYSENELLEMGVSDIHPRESLDYVMSEFTDQASGKKTLAMNIPCLRKDGTIVHTDVNTSIISLHGRKRIIGVFRDVSSRRNMEEKIREYSSHLEELVQERTGELKRSEERLRRIYDTTLNGLYTTSLEGEILDMNPAGLSLLGFENRDEARKTNIKTLYVDLDDRRRLIELAEQGPIRNFETKLRRRDGQIIETFLNTYPLRDEENELVGFQGTIVDITQIKQYQKRLLDSEARYREAERLSAIGKTAMMIGHDLRNPLQVVVNSLYLIRETLESLRALYPDSEEMRGSTTLLDRVDRQIEYMNKIVSDLQDYARPLRPEFAETGLDKLIMETLSTIRIPENIGVSKDIAEDARVTIDPAMMKRVFTNLITNAIQAMPNGGQLTIRASTVEGNILVSIKDTGAGIAKENIGKLFTPLFTTKAKGQGLGLPVCKRIVEAHKGDITVESEEGKGATFTLKLPLEEVN